MRVVVTGSRGWTDSLVIHDRLARLGPGTVIVHGNARGVDRIADSQAHMLGYSVERHPADWLRYGRRAGIVRNWEMLDTSPDLVIAFWDGVSRGTRHCIRAAQERGIPVEIHTLSDIRELT